MNVEALTLLRTKMAEIAEDEARAKRFNLDFWNNGVDLDAHRPGRDESQCGFAGCIMGWAGHEHWLDHLGLRIELLARASFNGERQIGTIRIYVREGDNWTWKTRSDTWELGQFFQIDPMAVEALIMPENYAGSKDPQAVVERLDYLLKHGDASFIERFHMDGRDEEEDNDD